MTSSLERAVAWCYSSGPAAEVEASMAGIRLTFLGGFEATLLGRAVSIPAGKARALLGYLALRPAGRCPRDVLATLLWADAPHERARQSLRQTLLTVRQALPGLLKEGEDVAIDRADVEVDVEEFERALAGAPDDVERAAALYRGDLLAGLSAQDAPFEEWLLSERERLRELVLEGLAKVLAHRIKSGEISTAIHTAGQLLRLDPAQEAVHRTLMRLYSQQGRRGVALRQYQACVAALERELGVEPEVATRELYQHILQRREAPVVISASASRASRPAADLTAEAITSERRLIGREVELAQLGQAFEQARSGQGRLVLVVGEAGIGKTRLVMELAAEAAQRGATVVVGHGFETARVLPLGPWVDAFRSAQIVGDRPLMDQLDPIWRAELGRLFPEVGGESLQPSGDAARLFEAVSRLIGQLAARAPVLLMLEDLQWADEMSLRLIGFLARRAHASSVLLVATVRGEDIPDAPILESLLQEADRDPRQLHLALSALSRDETLALVQALVPGGSDQASRAQIAEQVWLASEGNPFRVVETMRALKPGATPTVPSALPVPDRVRALIGSRLDRLSVAGRELAGVAAVIGRAFPFALLQQAAGMSAKAAAEAVEELVGRRVLHAVGERLDFTHDWIRRVTYERLLPPRRALLHAAVGEALEAVRHERLDDVADQLGHHYAKAGDARRAIPHLVRFAEMAVRRYALEEALSALQQAAASVDQLPASERDRRRLDLALRQGFTLTLLGRHRELLDLLDGHADLLARVADPRLASEYYFRLALTRLYFSQLTEAQRAAEQGLREGEASGDDEGIGKALHALSLVAWVAGRPDDGIRYATRGLPLLDQPRTQHYHALLYHDLSLNLVLSGNLDAASEAAQQREAIGQATHDIRLQGFVAYVGWIHILKGECDRAIAAAGRAMELSPDRMTTAIASGFLGQAHLERGEAASAVGALERAMETLGKISFTWSQGRFAPILAEAYLLAGEPARALDTACRALESSEVAGVPFNVALAQRALGRIARSAADLDEAERRLSQAVVAFTQCSAAFEVARTQLDLAAVRAARRDQDAARRHLTAAVATFEAAGAPLRAADARGLARSLGISLTTPAVE